MYAPALVVAPDGNACASTGTRRHLDFFASFELFDHDGSVGIDLRGLCTVHTLTHRWGKTCERGDGERQGSKRQRTGSKEGRAGLVPVVFKAIDAGLAEGEAVAARCAYGQVVNVMKRRRRRTGRNQRRRWRN